VRILLILRRRIPEREVGNNGRDRPGGYPMRESGSSNTSASKQLWSPVWQASPT
jgi:hypothetical protein